MSHMSFTIMVLIVNFCSKYRQIGIFNELLSTQNVNVTRNIECDFFGNFLTLGKNKTFLGLPEQKLLTITYQMGSISVTISTVRRNQLARLL